MPVYQDPTAPAQEQSIPHNENTAVHCAYHLISQLRWHPSADSPLPRVVRHSNEAVREVRPVPTVGFFGTQ